MYLTNIFSIIQKMQSWLLPSTCVLCAALSNRELDLCYACEQDLPWLTKVCRQCALPLAETGHAGLICGDCLQRPPPFFTTRALFYYQAPIDNFIMNLKFHQQLLYARLLGELLAKHLQEYYRNQLLPEYIIPVPLHLKRLRERGFNQAMEIARPIAKRLALTIANECCERTQFTATQSTLLAADRYQNIKNAFKVCQQLTAKYVAIVDDVVTTGSTVTELSKVLRQAGVERIDVWSIARTA